MLIRSIAHNRSSGAGRAAQRRIIEESLLFDRNWYLRRYPDVAMSATDPLDHYLDLGWREGRNPGPMFTTSKYLNANDDVARSGVNPLLHFIEFGLAEGRDGFGERHIPPSPAATFDHFPDAHECLSFARPEMEPLIWSRSYQLDAADPRLIDVGGAGAGYAEDDSRREAVRTSVQWLRALSGCSEVELPFGGMPPAGPGQRLVDAWYVNTAQLRMRWESDQLPLILRAFQCDAAGNGDVRLVGEGAITSGLDFVDVEPINAYFPILLVVAAPNGEIRDTDLLCFPSLCRGGMHYPELVWMSRRAAGRAVDIVQANRELTNRFVGLLRGGVPAAVGRIRVATKEADGNGPLFRKDLRLWLNRVVRIAVCAEGSATPLVADSSNSSPEMPSRDGGATLAIPADSAPTVGALVAAAEGSSAPCVARPAPLLVSRIDPSYPVIFIDVPGGDGMTGNGMPSPLPWLIPAAGNAPTDFPPVAIRTQSGIGLSDAQLLTPVSPNRMIGTKDRDAVTWLMNPAGGDESEFVQTVESIALQQCGADDALALVGASSTIVALARRCFPGRTTVVGSQAEAIKSLETPLVACVGPGLVLHDARIANCFSSMLIEERVHTASCVTVSAERRGSAAKVRIVDAGALCALDQCAAGPEECIAASAVLWGSNYPVLGPSRHLWATRSETLKMWMTAPAVGGVAGVHLYTAMVTATCLEEGVDDVFEPYVPSMPSTATKVEMLVG